MHIKKSLSQIGYLILGFRSSLGKTCSTTTPSLRAVKRPIRRLKRKSTSLIDLYEIKGALFTKKVTVRSKLEALKTGYIRNDGNNDQKS